MLEEEKGHLSWVKRWLDAQRAAGRREEVDAVMRRYAAIDAVVYASLAAELGWRGAA
jgi:hypothetical protein